MLNNSDMEKRLIFARKFPVMLKEFFDYKSNPFIPFLFFWFVLNSVFNAFVEVNGEEAYYWLFSQFPAWGYLDHPPMVAFFTAPFYALFSNPFGLRLGMVIGSILTLIVIRETLMKKDDHLFIWLILASALAHVGAYHLKTDVPLLLFVALFFYFYKKYLEKDDLLTVFLLAATIAGIMLSKHHGFLMVIFTVASNPRLFIRKSFWLVVLFTTVLMIPHTIWQIQHDFATIKFHLYNRIDMGFSWETIAYYIGVQPLVFGPLIGLPLILGSIFNKHQSDFRRALRYCLIGVFIFFLISSFKVEFHKHWTSILFVPLLILCHEYISERPQWRKWTKKLMVITLVLLIPGRIYLAHDFLPSSWTEGWDVIHGWDFWADEVEELSGGLPIVFNNHYERSSRYAYLKNDIVHCYNTVEYRPTHHDLLSLEEDLQGKTIFQINRTRDTSRYETYVTQIGKGIHYRVVEDFRSFRKVWIEMEDAASLENLASQDQSFSLKLTNEYEQPIDFSKVGGRKVYLNIHYLQGLNERGKERLLQLNDSMEEGSSLQKEVRVSTPDLPVGKYQIRFSIEVEGIEPPINSQKYKLALD